MSAAQVDPLWTARDVATFLRKSLRWVYGEAGAASSDPGRIPCTRVGGSLRFEPAAVRAWALRGVAARKGSGAAAAVPPPPAAEAAPEPAVQRGRR